MRRILPHIACLSLYLGIAVLVTYPLIMVFSTDFAGHPFGDSYENARYIWWMKHALRTGQPLFEQPWLLYPYGLSSAYLWGIPLQSFPAWLLAFVMPLPAAYNTQILLTMVLNGWAMWVFARLLTGNVGAAFVAGVVFMTFPTLQGHLGAGHVGLLAQWGLPLYGWWLLRYAAMPRRGHLNDELFLCLPGAVFFAITALGSTQMVLFTTLPLTLFLLVRARREPVWLRRCVMTILLGSVLAAVFAVPALWETLRTPARLPSEGGAVRFSSDALAVVSPSPYHPVYAALDYPDRVLGADPFEGASYLGLAAGGLAVLGLWRASAARGWCVLGAAAWVLSLGPLLRLGGDVVRLRADGYGSFVVLPYAALLNVPVLDIVRAPGRFSFLIGFVMAVLVGYGTAVLARWLLRRQALWRVFLCVIVALIVLDYQLWWRDRLPHLPTVPASIPEPITRLSEREDVRAVFHVPWQHLLVDKDALWLQTGYQRPMIAGHITRRTPLDPARGWLLQTFDPALLDAAGVDVIILHKEWADDALESFARAHLGTPGFEDERLIMWEAPDVPAALRAVTVMPDPTDRVSQADAFVFLPSPGQIRLTGEAQGDASAITLAVDGVTIDTWPLVGTLNIDTPLELGAGYHTLTLATEPACVQVADQTLRCRTFAADVEVLVESVEAVTPRARNS